MPHIKYANRYFRVASDELWLPGFCSVFARQIWLVMVLVIVGISSEQISSCPYGSIILTYISLTIGLLILAIIGDALIIRASLIGTMTEVSSRDAEVSNYLTVRLFVGFLQFLTAIFGCFVISERTYIPCADVFKYKNQSQVDIILLSIIVISQIIESQLLCCCFYLLSAPTPRPIPISQNESNLYDEIESDVINRWETRMKIICKSLKVCSCHTFGGDNIDDGYSSVARIFVNFFHHNGFLDITPSDVAAGILLVRMQQRDLHYRTKFRRLINQNHNLYASSNSEHRVSDSSIALNALEEGQLSSSNSNDLQLSTIDRYPTRPLDHNHDDDRLWVEFVAKHSCFAIGMYSHLLALYMQPVTGGCSLCWTCISEMEYTCCTCNTSTNSLDHVVSDSDGHTLPIIMKPRGSLCCFGNAASRSGAQVPLLQDFRRIVIRDNCVRANEAGALHIIRGRTNARLIFASFQNDLAFKPYAIFHDAQRDCVVIAIRGTLSLEDCITDVDCTSTELKEAGELWGFEGANRYAHSGMLASALSIRKAIENAGILAKLMTDESPSRANLYTPSSSSGYVLTRLPQLIVVGHSLGAGTAAVLSILLRSAYPQVKCISYGCPGSVLDVVSAVECRSYVTSVVLGSDMIARLSFSSLTKLREQVLDCICRSRTNKMIIFQSVFKDAPAATFLYRPGQEPSTQVTVSIRQFIEKMGRRVVENNVVELVMPGRIMHLREVDDDDQIPYSSVPGPSPLSYQNQGGSVNTMKPPLDIKHLTLNCCSKKRTYKAFESHLENFKELEVSPRMGWEHFPDRYDHEISDLYNEWKRFEPQLHSYNKSY